MESDATVQDVIKNTKDSAPVLVSNISESTKKESEKGSQGIKLILVDLQEALCKWFAVHFKDLPNVNIVTGRFEKLPEFDCMVSAGNSFGLMDGGVDAAITLYFGDKLQKRVQQYILQHFDGEQPIGTSFIMPTAHPKHPYLAHTPTMRVPYSIEGTDYVYLAMKAMLTAVRHHNDSVDADKRIRSVACTGLGTFYGKMELSEAARQMALAYKNFLHPPKKIDWNFAGKRQSEVIYGGYQGLSIHHAASQKSKKDAATSRGTIVHEMGMLAAQTSDTNMEHLDQDSDEEKDDVEWSDV